MTPYDILSAFDALPINEMPSLDSDDERAEIDRLLDIADLDNICARHGYDDCPACNPEVAAEVEAA